MRVSWRSSITGEVSKTGTNYFALENVCGCCGKPDEKWHICKSFRTFQGYPHDGPFRQRITSMREWLPILRDPHILIEDEYGQRFDPEKFIARCYEKGISPTHTWDEYEHGHYRDDEGFIFYNGDFF